MAYSLFVCRMNVTYRYHLVGFVAQLKLGKEGFLFFPAHATVFTLVADVNDFADSFSLLPVHDAVHACDVEARNLPCLGAA